MCGIVGYVGPKEATPIVLAALRRLEYRGYDSAGIASVNGGIEHRGFDIRRSEGSIDRLEQLLRTKPLQGTTAIGHTRWATHGKPSEKNAHPHRYEDVVIVHNGIIENFHQLRTDLDRKGHRFVSDTDSEVVAHLLQRALDQTGDLKKSCLRVVNELKGAFALAAVWSKEPETVFVARRHCPLLLGLGEGENFVASDIPALLAYTKNFIVLNDGEAAFISAQEIDIVDFQGRAQARRPQKIDWSISMAEKEGYPHFMLKEIHEQPRVIQDCLRGRITHLGAVKFDTLKWKKSDWASPKNVLLLACGSAWHAALVGKHWIEQIAQVHAEVDLGSEFRYRKPIVADKTMVIAISQSGETADTLGALSEAKKYSKQTLAVTNTVGSSLVRAAKNVVYTHAGPEISVASTKCFVGQLVVLALISAQIAEARRAQSPKWIQKFLKDLSHLPQQIEEVLKLEPQIHELAKKYKGYNQYFYLGRDLNFPIALEGALKLKEIAYINTQAYPAGEMKHGPIALISKEWPIVSIAPRDALSSKIISNMEVVRARGGKLITIGTQGDEEIMQLSDEFIPMPNVRREFTPILATVCLQLFSYFMAAERGCEIDKPRNLAKSVTVE